MNTSLHQNILKYLELSIKAELTPCMVFDRVSSDKQTDGFSLDYQKEKAELYTKHKKLQIIHIFEISESARIPEERKAFQQMISLAKQYDVKNIVFRCTDRMNRNHQDLHTIEQLIEKEGFKIHFYETGRIISKESSPDEKFMLSIETAVAKHHSDKISHYIRTTNEKKIKMGIAPIPEPPYGYRYDKEKKQHIKDENNKIVEWIFNLYDNEKISLQEIADQLNTKGIKSRRGKQWSTSTIHQILTGLFYTGDFICKGKEYPGNHEPYITREQYEKRQERMGIKYTGARKRNYDFPLANLLFFQDKALTGEMKKGKYVYYTNRSLKQSFKEEEIFDIIDVKMKDLEMTPEFAQFIETLFKDTIELKEDDSEVLLKELQNKIFILEQENRQLVEHLLVDPETIKWKMQENRDTIRRLEQRSGKLKIRKEDFMFEVASTIERCRNTVSLYQKATYKEKGDLLKKIALSICLTDNSIVFEWKKPYSYILKDLLEEIPVEVRKYPNMHASQDSNLRPTA